MKPHATTRTPPSWALSMGLSWLAGLGGSALLVWMTQGGHADIWLMVSGGALTTSLFVLLMDQWRRRHGAEDRAYAMQDNLALLAMVAQQTSNAVIITDAQRRITWVNAGFERITGYSAQEALGRLPGQLLQCGGTDAGVVQRMRASLDAGQPFLGELVNCNKNGQRYWVELDVQPIRDAQGVLTGYMALQSDITTRKQADSELRSSQSFLDKTGRIGGVGGWQLRLVDQALAWTDQTARILEADISAMPSVPGMLAFLTPQAETLLQAVMSGITPLQSYWDLELPLQTATGRQIWVRIVAECEYADGGITGLVGAIQDITARRAMKAEIKRSAELLRTAIDTIDEGFVLFDPQDRLVLCNERYKQLYATSADLLVPGTRFEDIIREGARRGQYSAAVGHEDEWVSSRLAMHQDGNTTLVQHLDNGKVLRILERRMPDGHIVSFRIDITDLVQASEEAQAANRAKSEFIATISHELRTPLQSILGFSELGMHFAQSQPPFEQMFTDVYHGGQRMLTLVNGLLDASRFDGRNHNLVRVQQDLRPLVDSVRGEMKALAQHKRQTLNLHWLDGPVWAGVDAFRFQQVIRNVLANALRFAPNDSAITIDAKDEGDQTWRIRISDQGPGIPDGELESIFLPFVQSSRTRDGAGGTGLGLHISSKIMQAHDGAIHAGNNAQGGAVMTLCLPKGAPTPGTQARHLAPVLRPPATPAVLATPH